MMKNEPTHTIAATNHGVNKQPTGCNTAGGPIFCFNDKVQVRVLVRVALVRSNGRDERGRISPNSTTESRYLHQEEF